MLKRSLLAFLAITLLFGCTNKSDQNNTTSLYFNGKIVTMDSDEATYVEAIAVEDGKIAFVGDLKEAEKQFSNTTKIDLNGKTLLPGFIDPHSHFARVSSSMGQVDLNAEPVGTVKNIDDLLAKLENYKEQNKISDGEWIYGWGYDDQQLEEKRHPTKNDIDKVLPNNPVYLDHTSGHMGVANSLALRKLKVIRTVAGIVL